MAQLGQSFFEVVFAIFEFLYIVDFLISLGDFRQFLCYDNIAMFQCSRSFIFNFRALEVPIGKSWFLATAVILPKCKPWQKSPDEMRMPKNLLVIY